MTSTTASPITDAVATVRRLDDVDIAFSALVDRVRGTFVVGDLVGARATTLQGLVIPAGCGVGGKCLALKHPVAVGCGNAEVARRLSTRLDTVKSCLKSAMSKLDCHNRGEAVFTARRAGLLP